MRKVKLALITDSSARRAAYHKRKKSLLKKVSELSILCGVSVCAIVYGPYNQRPEVWPSPSEAHRVLMKFKSLPNMEKSKKMVDQEMFLSERIMKLKEKLEKQQRVNRYNEITNLMCQSLAGAAAGNKTSLHDVGFQDLSDLAWLIEEKNREIRDRFEALNKQTAAAASNTNITSINGGGFNMNNVGGGDHHLDLLQVGMNMNGTGEQVAAEKAVVDHHLLQVGMNVNGSDEQVVAEKEVVDPMQAVVENLKRQNWFMPEVNMNMNLTMNMNINMDLNMNPTPSDHHHDPMMGGYLGEVGVLDHHHHPDQMQMGMGMEMGMASSSSTSYGGVADININNVAAAGWMDG